MFVPLESLTKKGTSHVSEKEVFLVEDGGRTALFAPRRGLIMEVDENEKERIAAFINQPQFSSGDLIEVFPEIEEDRLLLQKADEQATVEEEGMFSPDSAILFTTFDCNLRCLYCYANAGEKKVNMSRQIAAATVDFIIRNAKSRGQEKCSLGFHGGGEPTWNWPIFQFALSYFQEKARENRLTPEVSLATNGVLSNKQIDWIAQHLHAVQVSLDGMEEIQNFQRPTAGNRGSFAVVYNTVKSLLAKGIQVVIHSVVTERGVTMIPEIVHFFAVNFPGTTVHLEPACQCGRGLITNQPFPSAELFVRGFIEAQEVAKPFGVEVFYSGAGPQLAEFHRNFCGVSTPNFVVTPTGLVTACHEVAELEHPLAKYFIYGYLDCASKSFFFDYQKIRNLRSYGTKIDSACGECFARFYCAGDCLVKNLNGGGERSVPFLNPRCKVNRELTRHYIFNQLFSTRKEDCHECASSGHERPADQQRNA